MLWNSRRVATRYTYCGPQGKLHAPSFSVSFQDVIPVRHRNYVLTISFHSCLHDGLQPLNPKTCANTVSVIFSSSSLLHLASDHGDSRVCERDTNLLLNICFNSCDKYSKSLHLQAESYAKGGTLRVVKTSDETTKITKLKNHLVQEPCDKKYLSDSLFFEQLYATLWLSFFCILIPSRGRNYHLFTTCFASTKPTKQS